MGEDYLDLGFPDAADPQAKRTRGLEILETGIGGYVAVDGAPEVIALEADAELAADNEAAGQLVARAVWREFGRSMVGLLPVDATYAQALITITGTAGYIVTAGTQIAVGGQTFVLAEDATIGGGGTIAGVRFNAFSPGEVASGLDSAPQKITAWTDVTSYTLDEATSGGQEAETDTEYETRLRRYMPAAFGRPELAEDFAIRMLLHPEVSAALVLDGYNADTLATGQDATVTMIGRNSAGLPISTGAKDERLAAITAEKVSGWNIFVADPTYTTVDVTATVSVWPGYDTATVLAAVVDAIIAFLDPATWGASPGGLVLTNLPQLRFPDWNQEPTVLRSELTTAINDAHAGVRHLETLTLAAARAVTAVASTDVFTLSAHGFSNTDEITFSSVTGGAPIVAGTTYFVRDVTTNTFKIAATSGGTAINLTTDLTGGLAHHPLSVISQDVALAGVAKLPLAGIITATEA